MEHERTALLEREVEQRGPGRFGHLGLGVGVAQGRPGAFLELDDHLADEVGEHAPDATPFELRPQARVRLRDGGLGDLLAPAEHEREAGEHLVVHEYGVAEAVLGRRVECGDVVAVGYLVRPLVGGGPVGRALRGLG